MSRLLTGREDPFGRALLDRLAGGRPTDIVERDDGYIEVSTPGMAPYFTDYAEWPEHERWAADQCVGRVLDVGCGAGRFALHLQRRGHDVVGIDSSAGAIEASRARGVAEAIHMDLADVGPGLGAFDTILMMGNGFGLLGTERRARRVLKRFARLGSPTGRIVAEALDPYHTDDDAHLAYHARNRERGRLPGQLRIRVRYRDGRTPWFHWLLASRPEVGSLLDGTGWVMETVKESDGPLFAFVLERIRPGGGDDRPGVADRDRP